LTAAGAESNVATYLSRLGSEVAWLSRVGADYAGDFIVSYLESEGVSVSEVEVDLSSQTGVAVKEPGKEASVVRYYRRGSAASKIGKAHVAALETLAPHHIHLTGINAALSPSAREFMMLAFQRLHEKSKISFDVNLRPQLWEKTPSKMFLAFAKRSATVFVGLDEAFALWGSKTPQDVRAILPTVPNLVVKQGPDGATVFSNEGELFVSSLKVNVVEPVGAGDAFAAGFLHAQSHGEKALDCARLGTILACASLSSHQDIGEMPPNSYIDHLMGLSDVEWLKERYLAQ